MAASLVSVIIPAYNYARFLPQAIDSVLAQTYAPVEIIVVDDGSQDDSQAVLNAYGTRIRWVSQHNQGVAAARNHGTRLSQGSYLAFLDADDYWLPTKLERQMELYARDPELGLTHCGVGEFDDQQGVLRQRQEGMAGWVGRELLLLERPVILGGGSGLVLPRALFEAVGGFDERLSTSADWDLFHRVAIRQRVGFTPEVLVRYRLHGSNMHGNVAAMEQDVLHSYHKVFATAPHSLRQIRRRCYGNMHLMLAGSYFNTRQYAKCASHVLKGMWFRPTNTAWYLLGFPFRARPRGV